MTQLPSTPPAPPAKPRRALVIAYELPPMLLAGAVWTAKLLGGLARRGWGLTVLTGAEGAAIPDGPGAVISAVPNSAPWELLGWLDRAKLGILREWLVWPDETVFWRRRALAEGRRLVRLHRHDLILNFMMPYSTGIIGATLAAETRLPLVYGFSDSLSCTDMVPSFPTGLHFRAARRLEDFYIRRADASFYVSEFNARQVADRLPSRYRDRVHTVRLGADPDEFHNRPTGFPVDPARADQFRITYIGSLGGWYEFHPRRPRLTRFKRRVEGLLRYSRVELDHRTHTPVFVGRAVQQVLARRPEWRGRVGVHVYGPRIATAEHIEHVLKVEGLADCVHVHGPQSRAEIARQTRSADLLFQCVQDRCDSSPGGRIASKTYEYLMTDRPILAAVPAGENWDYYAGRPGVWLTRPADVAGMAAAIEEVAAAKFAGRAMSFDRSALRAELSYDHRAEELERILLGVLERRNRP